MALNVTNIKRVFRHKDEKFADPAAEISPHDVLQFYSNTYPELTTASVTGPEIKDGVAEYKFTTSVGTKG